jgi:hypothetical protein
MRQPLGFGCLKHVLRPPGIVGTRIVNMDHGSFQCLPTITRSNIGNWTWDNLFADESCIICHTFGDVNEIVNSVHSLKDGNKAFFGANFLAHSFGKLIARCCPRRVMPKQEKELRLVCSDNSFETILFCILEFRSTKPRISDSFALPVRGQGV